MKSILVADDNEQNLYLLRTLLAGSGYDVVTASDGEQALEMARAQPPAVVISDILMPVMDGFTLCRNWKADEQLRQVPFIFYTATYTDEHDEAFARNLGADGFIHKPVEPDALLDAVRDAIELGAARNPADHRPRIASEEVHLRQYNRVLLRKLEDKMEQLEQANQLLERRVAERTVELEERNQTLEAFAYSMAHDLGAPLRGIRGFAGLLQAEEADALTEEGRANLQVIIDSSDMLSQMMKDLLRYATLGRSGLGMGPVPLPHVMEHVRREFAPQLEESRATLLIPDELPTVQGEFTLLSQIFANLIRNALTYCRPGEPPWVEVRCEQRDDVVVIAVSDNGVGIREAQLDQVFSLFRRLNSQEEFPGSGVGLGIVERAVRLMGGRVWVESEFGRGSTFFVELPRPSDE